MALVRKRLIGITGGEDKEGPRYDLVYWVKVDSTDEGPATVRSYVGWSYGDVYTFGSETDSLARATSITEKPIGTSRYEWEVTVSFTRPPKEDSGQASENPLADPIQIEWGYEDRQIAVERDVNGTWICNAAQDRYDEIIYADDFRRLVTITRNEATFPKALADALSNKLNAAVWNGYAAKTVKLKPITASRAYNQAIGLYWVVRYEFQFAPIGGDWKRYILNAGLNQIVSGQKKRITDDES
ncbi:MAG: hypothetical protein ACTHK7_11390, partial [Aureliella sp.]